MGRYTVLEAPEADAAVQEVLDRVCSDIVKLLGDNLQAIVLVGGYGRGEGGAYRVGPEYYLVNDIDMLVFVKNGLRRAKKRFKEPLEHLVNEWLVSGRGLKGIDVELVHLWQYRLFVPNTVGYYEIANGHQVIYGNLNRLMRRLDPKRLPAYEGTNYFRNRGSALLIPAVYFLTDGLQDPGKRENFQIEMQKACQAMGDACLLMAGQYHFSYRERLRRFRKIRKEELGIPSELFEKVALLYEWGMTSKVNPCFEWPGNVEIIKKWFLIRDIFGDFFLWFESIRLGYEFRGWDEYAYHIAHRGAGEHLDLKLKSALWTILSSIRRRQKGGDYGISPIQRTRQGLIIMPLLLFSLTPGLEVKTTFIARAAMFLSESVSAPDLDSWESLVAQYLLAFYPTRVVREALAPLRDNG